MRCVEQLGTPASFRVLFSTVPLQWPGQLALLTSLSPGEENTRTGMESTSFDEESSAAHDHNFWMNCQPFFDWHLSLTKCPDVWSIPLGATSYSSSTNPQQYLLLLPPSQTVMSLSILPTGLPDVLKCLFTVKVGNLRAAPLTSNTTKHMPLVKR